MNIRTESEAITVGAALSDAELIKLQTWFSPAFPIGGFTYSHGLEWVVETGEVGDVTSLQRWSADVIEHGAGRSDAILLSTVWRAALAGNCEQVQEIAGLAAALQPSSERRLESLSQGTAFLSAVASAWPHPLVERFAGEEASYPVAAGIAAAAHALPLEPVLLAYLHAFAANLVSAGVRLVPLGQTDGLRTLAGLEPIIRRVAAEACSASIEDIGSSTFLADVASMRHETQYTRLFRS